MRTIKFWMLFISIVVLLSIGWEAPMAPLVEFGKIYTRDNIVLVSELTYGIRFLDVTNPSAPLDLGRLDIKGNHDMALVATNNGATIHLYADSYSHLIVYNVSDPRHPVVVDTVFNIFQNSYQQGWGDPRPAPIMPTTNFIGGARGCSSCNDGEFVTTADSPAGQYDTRTSNGTGGSMARFAVVDNYLYCIDYNQLYVFDVTTPTTPRYLNKINIGWGIETLFPYENYLFIGGQNGMVIYSRNNPRNPQYVSTFTHARACDPVVVEDTLAYITLRGNKRCGQVVSALHVVNIKNLMKPSLLVSYPLPQPMGLAVRDRIAYVCDDSSGLVILNTEDVYDIKELSRVSGNKGYDAINTGWLLVVSSRTNVSFYNVSNPSSPVFLGRYGFLVTDRKLAESSP